MRSTAEAVIWGVFSRASRGSVWGLIQGFPDPNLVLNVGPPGLVFGFNLGLNLGLAGDNLGFNLSGVRWSGSKGLAEREWYQFET